MTGEDVLNEIADISILVGFIPFAAFMLDYVLIRPLRGYQPWWRSPIGWMFAMLGVAITVIGGLVVASLWLGPHYWGRPIFRALGYPLFTVAGVMLCVVYFAERGSAEPVLFHKRKRAPK